jgi:hypothetical protein
MTRTIRKDGYVSVWDNGEQYLEHRKLAELFIPNPNNKSCVNHKDGNRCNNNLDNLEWVTYSENHIHAHRVLGRKLSGNAINMVNGKYKREGHPSSKLNEKQILEIKNSKLTGIELSNIYNVSRSLISMIKNNKRWN